MSKMKNRHVMMVFGAIFSLLFLQLSCAGMREPSVEEASATVEDAVEWTGELAGMHKLAGISCSDCHAESPPASAVPEAVCLTCHEDYRELTAGLYEDPHNAHMAFPDCGNCHHVHQPSENQCLACHAF
jgi:uncharacterized membrane protein